MADSQRDSAGLWAEVLMTTGSLSLARPLLSAAVAVFLSSSESFGKSRTPHPFNHCLL